MANFTYKVGNVLNHVPADDETLLIPHIVNDENVMGSGLAAALSKKWPEVKKQYHKWARESAEGMLMVEQGSCPSPFKLGRNQFVRVDKDIVVVNMIAQSDCGGYKGYVPIRYQSLEECLLRIAKALALQKFHKNQKVNVATGLIGSGLAGGNWRTITEIVRRVFKDLDFSWTWYCLTEQEMSDAVNSDIASDLPPKYMLDFMDKDMFLGE